MLWNKIILKTAPAVFLIGGDKVLRATQFTYDGIYSGQYGLLIADFDKSNVDRTTPFRPTVKTVKATRRDRFSFAGIQYENTPQFTFSFISRTPIPDIIRREILTWLVGRHGFRKLQIHQPDYEEYTYNCIFSDIQIVFVNGECVGFNLQATFDSPYCYGKPKIHSITTKTLETVGLRIINESDIVDGFVYPKITVNTSRHEFEIINLHEPDRPCMFTNLTPPENLVIDNELRIINSDIGGDRLSCFNKNWLRLRRGVNELRIKVHGTVAIECPTFVLIGF